MATSITVGPITLTTTGERTGYWLGIFQADAREANDTVTWTGVDMSPDGFNAQGPFTYAVPASIANDTSTPVGNTSAIARADNLAIQAGCVNIYVANFNGALANAADDASLTGYGPGSLLDTWGDNDSALVEGNNDTVAAGGTGDFITASGIGDTVAFDSNFSGSFTQTEQISDYQRLGGSDTIVVGGATNAAPPAGAAPAVTGQLDLQAGNAVTLQDPAARDVLVLHGQGNTINDIAGADTIFASAGNDLVNRGGGNDQFYFVGAAAGDGGLDGKHNIVRNDGTYAGNVGVSTINGGAGNSTVFAKAGVAFNEGGGANVFVGGSVADLTSLNPGRPLQAFHSTVTGGASGHNDLFGGTVGDLYNVGGGSDNLFVNGGGSDTISGGSTAPVVFGNTGGGDKLVNTKGGLLVADGGNDTIDASAASQGNLFFANNAASVGNATLSGSSAAPTATLFDEFVVGDSGGGAAAHTLTIGFQAGDALFLSGYSITDDQNFAAAVANQAGGANFAVTLSDQTTIQFVGAHPTTTFDNGTVAL